MQEFGTSAKPRGINGTLGGLVEVAGRFVMSFARLWSISWSAQETPSVPTMTRRPGTMTGHSTARPVTDVSSSRRPVAKRETCT
jgi:hypothetical protein